ncbi:hypothetical protein [Pelagibacterium sp.]|uniref:hypothetical protein n=1 Tax=Pelagibacterium sp. TaxID=1967288 RepID=UPI003A94C75F
MSDEASNILRRFVRIAAQLGPEKYGFLRKSARTLDPEDLRRLAREYIDVYSQTPIRDRHINVYRGGPRPVPRYTPDRELRGLARSIIRCGGPDAVRRDADPLLVEAVNQIGWWP